MVEATDSIAIALREVTKRSGRLLWGDPVRLRSRLQYALGSVSEDEGAVLDAVVLGAIHKVPQALVHRGDLSASTRALSDEVGPVLGARAVALWARAVAEMGANENAELALVPARALHRVPASEPKPARSPEPAKPVAWPVDFGDERDDEAGPEAAAPAATRPPRRRRRRLRTFLVFIGFLLIAATIALVLRRGDGTDVEGATETRPAVMTASPVTSNASSTSSAPATIPSTTPMTAPPATTALGSSTTALASSTTLQAPSMGRYVLASPARLLDTRGSAAVSTATVSAGSLPGLTNTAGITAVMLQITVENPSGPGGLRAVAAGAGAGQATHLNFAATPRTTGLVFAPLAADGRIDLRLSGATASLVVDAVGYVASTARTGGTSLVGSAAPLPLPPLNVPAGGTVELALPDATLGALLSVVARTSAPGAVTFFSGTRPDTPSLVLDRSGATSSVVLAAAPNGKVSVHATVAVQLSLFEVARFSTAPTPPAGALSLSSADPVRATSGTCSDRAGKGISRISSVFPTARAFVLSVSVERAPAEGSLAAYTTPAPIPGMADVSFAAGEVRSAPVFVMISGDRINLLCAGGLPDFVVDIVAVFE